MKKIIRVPGLIAFFVILGLTGGLSYLFSETLIKSAIEKNGTNLARAKVEVNSLELSLSPASIKLVGFQVADYQAPMTNALELDNAVASLDLMKLFMGQVIVNELNVEGLQFNTERSQSGYVEGFSTNEQGQTNSLGEVIEGEAKEIKTMVKGELPSTDEVLAKEPLLTIERKDVLLQTFESKQAEWAVIKADLPEKEAIARYETEIKAITEGKVTSLEDFQARKKRLDQLKQDIKVDREKLANAKTFIEQSQDTFKSQIDDLRRGPKDDLARLREKYSLDEGGALNLAKLLFGDKVATYGETALAWYKRVEPMLEKSEDNAEVEAKSRRGKGKFIHFDAENPMPEFLIRQSKFSVETARGKLSADAKNITHQQDVMGIPTTLAIDTTELRDIGSVSVNATFDHRNGKAEEIADILVSQIVVADLSFSQSDSLSINMPSALVDVKGNIKLSSAGLSGQFTSEFTQAQLVGEGTSSVAKELARVFKSIDNFDVDVALSGNLKDIDIDVKSNLDKKISSAFSARLDEKRDEWEAELKQKLEAKAANYIQENKNLSRFIGAEEGAVLEQISSLDSLAKSKLTDYKEQKKEEAKEKLADEKKKREQDAKDKLKKKLDKFF